MEEVIKISKEQFIKDIEILAEAIKSKSWFKDIKQIFGIPRGGEQVATILAELLNLPLSNNRITTETLVVDDLIDSGRTLIDYATKYNVFSKVAILYIKPGSAFDRYACNQIGEQVLETVFVRKMKGWIEFFYENTDKDDEQIIVRMLERIGENPNREGLVDTPKRVVKMWKEIFRGYDEKQKPNITIFDNDTDGISYDQMVYDNGYYFSQCEHHMVPFFGEYHFAYIPDKKVIGLSKIARIVDFYSAKLQIQERLVKEIVDEIERVAKPKGIALVMKGRHLCKEMRGVKKINSSMITSELRGAFKDNIITREEFLKLCKL